MAFVIEEELKKLPALPGVYLMQDAKDEIIYVGKALCLKNRVRQYFQSSRDKSAKIQQMIARIARFEYIVTDSELEALVLENNLIKEHRPRYNTMLRDDKTYPYIKVTVKEDFPRIFMTRRLKKDKAKYYGPFSSAQAVKQTLDLICKAFKIRTCSRVLPRDIGKARPCLNYHIHQCDAPCYAYVDQEKYLAQVRQALDFLNGNVEAVIEEVRERMQQYSAQMEYEEAARQRDLLNSLLHVAQRQKISSEGLEDRDIIALARDEKEALIQIFFVREGKMVGREHHYIQLAVEEEKEHIVESFVKQFYAGTPFLPAQIYLQYELPDAQIIESWLSAKKSARVRLLVPKKGEKERLVELARKNAELILAKDREKLQKEQLRSRGAVKEIEELIGTSGLVRMEAYDISNISGEMSVGSMVVYENGKAKPSDYRKFRIKSVQGADDYASLREVLTRRFRKALEEDEQFAKLPDLILMDGGKGQVNVCLEVLKQLGLGIKVCGMVKDDRHRTRGLYYENREILPDTRGEGFHLLTRIQDEAHRFAVEYHRSLRTKTMVKSSLDDIKGIGPVRRRALMKHFKEIENIKKASIEELAQAAGMDKKSAAAVYAYFHAAEEKG